MKPHHLLLNHSMTSLHMAPMSDVLMHNQLIGGLSVSTHALFWTAVGMSLVGRPLIWANIDGVSSSETSSFAAEPFHVLPPYGSHE
jgi:hypothetical protein